MYDQSLQFDFGPTSSQAEGDSLRVAAKYDQDCTLLNRDPENYEGCSQYFPEKWTVDQAYIGDMIQEGVVEVPQVMGVIGYEGIFMTKFTAEQEPSFLNYFGLAGEGNRQKMAETFLTPWTGGRIVKQSRIPTVQFLTAWLNVHPTTTRTL